MAVVIESVETSIVSGGGSSSLLAPTPPSGVAAGNGLAIVGYFSVNPDSTPTGWVSVLTGKVYVRAAADGGANDAPSFQFFNNFQSLNVAFWRLSGHDAADMAEDASFLDSPGFVSSAQFQPLDASAGGLLLGHAWGSAATIGTPPLWTLNDSIGTTTRAFSRQVVGAGTYGGTADDEYTLSFPRDTYNRAVSINASGGGGGAASRIPHARRAHRFFRGR